MRFGLGSSERAHPKPETGRHARREGAHVASGIDLGRHLPEIEDRDEGHAAKGVADQRRGEEDHEVVAPIGLAGLDQVEHVDEPATMCENPPSATT